jgi:hypothetical protein
MKSEKGRLQLSGKMIIMVAELAEKFKLLRLFYHNQNRDFLDLMTIKGDICASGNDITGDPVWRYS